MRKLKTVFISMTPLLYNLIKEVLCNKVSIECLGELPVTDEVLNRLKEMAPDLVLVGLSSDDTDRLAMSILCALPDAKVITYTSDGRHAYVNELIYHQHPLIDVSPQTLISAIVEDLQHEWCPLPKSSDFIPFLNRDVKGI